jgi:hypothetical protein
MEMAVFTLDLSPIMLEIFDMKVKAENKDDFRALMKRIDRFRDLNYSRKRKRHTLTP